MDFRQNAARRRRVMRDERAEVVAVAAPSMQQPLRRYCAEEVLASQPTLLQFLPKRPWLVAVVLACTLIAAALVLVAPLCVVSPTVGDWALSSSPAELLDAGRPGSLAQVGLQSIAILNWVLAFQIFHLRRHREDDYHGVYQVWWWCLWPLAIVSLLSSGMVAEVILAIVSACMPAEWIVTATWFVLLSAAAVAGLLVPRLFAELRECLTARVFLCFAAFAAVGFAVVRTAGTYEWSAGTAILLTSPLEWWILFNVFSFACLLTTLSYVSSDVAGQVEAMGRETEGTVGEVAEQTVGIPQEASREGATRDVVGLTEVSGTAAVVQSAAATVLDESGSSGEHSDATLLQRRKRRRVA